MLEMKLLFISGNVCFLLFGGMIRYAYEVETGKLKIACDKKLLARTETEHFIFFSDLCKKKNCHTTAFFWV